VAPLRGAVEALMWTGAGFLSCVQGQLGHYVSEDGSNGFVLKHEPLHCRRAACLRIVAVVDAAWSAMLSHQAGVRR
jgi:hypothetical protein